MIDATPILGLKARLDRAVDRGHGCHDNVAVIRRPESSPMHDRAATVAPAVMRLLIDTMHGKLSPTEFFRQLEQLLRDEFADERRQAMADRELPDA